MIMGESAEIEFELELERPNSSVDQICVRAISLLLYNEMMCGLSR